MTPRMQVAVALLFILGIVNLDAVLVSKKQYPAPDFSMAFVRQHVIQDPIPDPISEATAYCYERLMDDMNLHDTHLAPGVENRKLRRPGTNWTCDDSCHDPHKGERGIDALWIPAEATCSSPRILFVHGGAFVFTSPHHDAYPQLASKLAKMTGAMVMLPDFPLSSPHSGGYKEVSQALVSALQWLASHGPQDDCPEGAAAPLFVGGDSAGAGPAFSLAIQATHQAGILRGRTLAGAFFHSPWTNLKCDTQEWFFNSYSRIVDDSNFKEKDRMAFLGDIIFHMGPLQKQKYFTEFALEYVGSDATMLTDPMVSPYYATAEHLAGLPPLYFAAGGSESFLGDSTVLAGKAAQSGVDVTLEVYAGMWHTFTHYTEGCGSGKELWSAVRALNMTAFWIRHVAETGRPPFTATLQRPLGGGGVGKSPVTDRIYPPTVPYLESPNVDLDQLVSMMKAAKAKDVPATSEKSG